MLLQIKNFSDIYQKIIPFFDQYPILGVKRLDFADFKKVAEIVNNKEHLTEAGFRKVLKIAETMNLDRNNIEPTVVRKGEDVLRVEEVKMS